MRTPSTSRPRRWPSAVAAWLATSTIGAILALAPPVHAQSPGRDPALDHLVAYAEMYRRLDLLKGVGEEIGRAYELITWTQRTLGEAAAERPPPSSAFDTLDLDDHIEALDRRVQALPPLAFEAPLRTGPVPTDRHARRASHRERAQALGAAAAEVLVARGGVTQTRAYRAQLEGADAYLGALSKGFALMLERGAYAIPVLGPLLPQGWFDIEVGYRPRLAGVRSDLEARARNWERQIQARAAEVGRAIDAQLGTLAAEERALAQDREQIERTRAGLEEWAERIRALEATLQGVRAQLASARNAITDAEAALTRNSRDRNTAVNNRQGAEQRLRNAQHNLSLPFEQTGYRCPNGRAWSDCGHDDLKREFNNWRRTNQASADSARQQIASANQAIERLDRQRPTLERALTDAKQSVQNLQVRERDTAFDLEAQRAGYAVSWQEAWRWAVESRAEAYTRELLSERAQLNGLKGRLQ